MKDFLNKKSIASLIIAVASVSSASAAAPMASPATKQFTPSANVSYSSQYLFRGLQQSDRNIAVSGGFDLNHSSGLYVGTWSSNVAYGVPTSIETDIYMGLSKTFMSMDFDMGGIYYMYPGAASSLNYDFFEAYISASKDLGLMSFTLAGNYSPEFFGESGKAVYGNFSASMPVSMVDGLTLTAMVGRQYVKDPAAYGVAKSYNDYGLSAEYSLDSTYSVSLGVYDTNLDEGEAGYLDGPRFVAQLSASIG